MTRVSVECLGCGHLRTVERGRVHGADASACPRCGYVGWAYADELSESDRRGLRDLPVELRAAEPALRLAS